MSSRKSHKTFHPYPDSFPPFLKVARLEPSERPEVHQL